MTRAKSKTRINKGKSQDRTPANFARPATPISLRASGRRGEALASARDRQRLRERNSAERERVEGVIASAAVPVERRAHPREPVVSDYASSALSSPSSGLRAVQPMGCPVCGDGRIVTDEVMHGGTLRVSECLHCEHRWTQRPKGRWVELGTRMNRAARPRALQAVQSDLGVQTHPSQFGRSAPGETARSV